MASLTIAAVLALSRGTPQADWAARVRDVDDLAALEDVDLPLCDELGGPARTVAMSGRKFLPASIRAASDGQIVFPGRRRSSNSRITARSRSRSGVVEGMSWGIASA